MDIHPTDTEILESSAPVKPFLAFSWGPLYETMQELKETGDNDYDDPVMKRGFALFQTLEKAETIMQIRKAVRQANFSENEINKLNSPCFDGIIATMNNEDPILKLIVHKKFGKYVDTFKFYLRYSMFRLNNLIYMACSSKDENVPFVKILIEAGANVLQKKNKLLKRALINQNIGIAKLLLENGVDIHYNNDEIRDKIIDERRPTPALIEFFLEHDIKPTEKFFREAPFSCREKLEPYLNDKHSEYLYFCCRFAYAEKIREFRQNNSPRSAELEKCIHTLKYSARNEYYYSSPVLTSNQILIFDSLKALSPESIPLTDISYMCGRSDYKIRKSDYKTIANIFSQIRDPYREIFLELAIRFGESTTIRSDSFQLLKENYPNSPLVAEFLEALFIPVEMEEKKEEIEEKEKPKKKKYKFPTESPLLEKKYESSSEESSDDEKIPSKKVTYYPANITFIEACLRGRLDLLENFIEKDSSLLDTVLIWARYKNHVHILRKYKDHIKTYYKSVFEDESLKFTPIKGATEAVWNDFRTPPKVLEKVKA